MKLIDLRSNYFKFTNRRFHPIFFLDDFAVPSSVRAAPIRRCFAVPSDGGK